MPYKLQTEVCGDIPPLCGDIPPLCGDIPPLCGDIDPLCGDIPPLCGDIPPLCGDIPPLCGNHLYSHRFHVKMKGVHFVILEYICSSLWLGRPGDRNNHPYKYRNQINLIFWTWTTIS